MTTIATDGRSMAGDGRGCAADKIRCDSEIKVRRLKDGRIIGFSGTSSTAKAHIAWLEGGEKPATEKNFHLLVMEADGTVRVIYDDLTSDPVDLPAVLGSGGDLALGAMLVGATPEDAVKIAASRDPFTGGKITVLERKPR